MTPFSISHPLSQTKGVRKLECTSLSETFRAMWGAWSRHFPFAEVRHVLRDEEALRVTYAHQPVILGRRETPRAILEFLLAMREPLPKILQEASYVAYTTRASGDPSIVLRLAVPYARGKPVAPSARCTPSASGHSLGKLGHLLASAFNDTSEISPQELTALKRCNTPQAVASWLNATLLDGPIQLPFSPGRFVRELSGTAEFTLRFDLQKQHAWLCTNEWRRRVWPNKSDGPPGVEMKAMDLPKNPAPNCLEIQVDPKGVWEQADASRFNRLMLRFSGRSNAEAEMHLLSTLMAERVQMEQRCWPYQLKEELPDGIKLQLLPKEPHPFYGDMARADGVSLYDHCLTNQAFEFLLNRAPEYFAQKKGDVECHLLRVDSEDPNLLEFSTRGTHRSIPKSGWIRQDDVGTRVLNRRKERMVRTALTSRAAVRAFLPASSEDMAWQREAWESRSPSWRLPTVGALHVVQGPPGTGKTWTATRLIEDTLRVHPEAKILVCGKEHLALDHLVAEARDSHDGKLRLSTHREGVESTHQEAQTLLAGVLASGGELAPKASRSLVASLNSKGLAASWPINIHRQESRIVGATLASAAMDNIVLEGEVFDLVVVEEAGKCYPSELAGALAVGRNVILIGDQMQLPPFEIDEITGNLQSLLHALNNPTKKPSKLERDCENAVRSVFQLKRDDNIPEEFIFHTSPFLQPFKLFHERGSGDVEGSTTLYGEYRMFEELSNLVGEVFYDGPFEWAKDTGIDPHQLPEFHQKHGRLVLVDLPHCSDERFWMERRSSTGSLHNKEEARLAVQLAQNLAEDAQENAVVILTPYIGQREMIRTMLEEKGSKIEVHTVDGFQGKERDFVVLSLVRNNDKSAARRWGFVRDARRLNVALSRAREGLVVLCSLKHLAGSSFSDDEMHLERSIRSVSKAACLSWEDV